MDIKKLNSVLEGVKDSSNKELVDASDLLKKEFEATKKMIADLTIHLQEIEKSYIKIVEEIEKRSS